jgi:hypothetical protein
VGPLGTQPLHLALLDRDAVMEAVVVGGRTQSFTKRPRSPI